MILVQKVHCFPKGEPAIPGAVLPHECILGASTHIDALMSNMVVEATLQPSSPSRHLAGPFLLYPVSDFHQTVRREIIRQTSAPPNLQGVGQWIQKLVGKGKPL